MNNFEKLLNFDNYLKLQTDSWTGSIAPNPIYTIGTVDLIFVHHVCGYQHLVQSNDSVCYDWPIKMLKKIARVTDGRKYYASFYRIVVAKNLGCTMSHSIINDTPAEKLKSLMIPHNEIIDE